MRILTDEHWKHFQLPSGKKSGERFESLVLQLLEARYGKGTWIQTKQSWDGSKDFYYYNNQTRMWAECKNYTSAVSLDVLSPTLIMAQICEIDDVLFFSYSRIVPQAKTKFIHYADRSNKRVFFFDDEALEELILEYRNSIFPQFFPHLVDTCFDNYSVKPWIQHSVVCAPVFHNKIMSDSVFLTTDFPDSINLFSVWGIYVLISNQSNEILRFNISIHESSTSIYQFDYITAEYLDRGKSVSVKPFETVTAKILFRVVKYTEEVSIPDIIVSSEKSKEDLYRAHFRRIKCNWIAKTPLIGKSYRDIRDQFSSMLVNRESSLGVCFWGASGNGKSRMLEECMNIALRHEYSVLHFNTQQKSSSIHKAFSVLKEIILALYQIPNVDIINYVDSESLEWENYGLNKAAFEMIHSFTEAESTADMMCLIDQYSERIFEHIIQQRYVLAVDNVQFFDGALIYFLRKLIGFMGNTNRYNPTIVLLTINTDYLPRNSEASELFVQCKGMGDAFCMYHLTGFISDNESLIFLNELLASNIRLRYSTLNEIIQRTGHNPLFIFHTIEWFKDKRIIYYSDDYFQSIDEKRFRESIEQIPESIEQMIKERWTFFINENDFGKSLDIISLIHYFDGLDTYKQKQLQIDNNMAEKMIQANLLLRDESNTYYFAHDMIEKFFSENYRLVEHAVLYRLFDSINVTLLTSAQYNLYVMYKESSCEIDTRTLNKLVENTLTIYIPRFLQYEYLDRLFELLENSMRNSAKTPRLMENAIKLVQYIRDELGSKRGTSYFDRLNSIIIRNRNSCYRYKPYSEFIFRYCEAYDHAGLANRSIELIIPYVNYLEKRAGVLSNRQLEVLCECYNRLHVYNSHLVDSPLTDSNCRKMIVNAFKINRRIECPIMLFTNYSDLGHLYYNKRENANNVKILWKKACDVYEKHDIKEKTLNYIRKEVQISLIDGNLANAHKLCEMGLDYCTNGKYAYEKLHFRQWFSIAMLCVLLMNPNNLNYSEINSWLSVAEEYLYLLNTPKSYKLTWIKGIYAYWKKEYRSMLEYWLQTLKILNTTKYMKHKSFNIRCLEENIIYVLASPSCRSSMQISSTTLSKLPFHLQERISISSLRVDNTDIIYECSSMIHDMQSVINFPLV